MLAGPGSAGTRTAVACPSNAPAPLSDIPNAASTAMSAMLVCRGPPAGRTVNGLRDRIDDHTPKCLVRSTPVPDRSIRYPTRMTRAMDGPRLTRPVVARKAMSINGLCHSYRCRDTRGARHLRHPNSFNTSPGVAWRPRFDFSNIGTPSRKTSNRPPFDGINVTSASGYRARISAAKLVARAV